MTHRSLEGGPCFTDRPLRVFATCSRWHVAGRGLLFLGVVLGLGVILVAGSGRRAEAFGSGVQGYRFLLPTRDAQPGQALELEVRGLYEQSAQGFSFAARFPVGSLEIDRIHIRDTILESIRVDFFQSAVDVERGTITVGALVDTRPPFNGELIPNIGCPLTLFRMNLRVSAEASGDLVIETADDLGVPPIFNGYSVGDEFHALSEMARGVLRVPNRLAMFLRGDANQDGSVDVSDPVAILDYSFLGGRTPGCMDAADVNDDERVGLSDAVFLLAHLFQGGAAPPRPFQALGVDPDGFELDCAQYAE